jgi:hypothetical protein
MKFSLYALEAESAATGQDISASSINSNDGSVLASDSITEMTLIKVAKEMTITKTVPTLATQTIASSTLSNGSEKEIYKFSVSADSSGDVVFKKVVLQISGSEAAGNTALDSDNFSNFKVLKDGVEQTVTVTELTTAGASATDTSNDLGEIAIVFTDVQVI